MEKTNIEVEGGELLIMSKEGHYAVIPSKDRSKVKNMLDTGCEDCINSYINKLPKEKDYAEDGSLLSSFINKAKSAINKGEDIAKDVYNKAKTTVKPYVETVKNTVEDVVYDASNIITDIKKDAQTAYQVAKNKVLSASEDVGETKHNQQINSNVYDFSEIDSPKKSIDRKEYSVDRSQYTYKSLDDVDKTCKDLECTSAITNNYLKSGQANFVDKFNARGSGWTMQQNLENAGASSIANVFSFLNLEEKEKMSKSDVIKYVNETTSSDNYKNNLKSNLQGGDYVSLLYPDSKNFEKAKQQSNNNFLTTHGGEIVVINGEKMVRDNVHGVYNYRPLDKVLEGKDKDGVRISGAVNLSKTEEQAYYEDNNFKLNTAHVDSPSYENLFSKAAYRASEAQNANKKAIMTKYDIDEATWEKYKKVSKSIMMKESNFGRAENNEKYNADSGRSFVGKVKDIFTDVGEAVGYGEESRTLGNIKFKNYYSDDELTDLGLKEFIDSDNASVMESPEVSGIMVMDALLKNKQKFNSMLKGVPKSIIEKNKEIFEKLEYISWNQGYDNIKINVDNWKKTGDINELKKYFVDDKGKSTQTYGDIISLFNDYQVKKN
jgi:hypothetical protein